MTMDLLQVSTTSVKYLFSGVVDTAEHCFGGVVSTTPASGASDQGIWGVFECAFSWRFQWHCIDYRIRLR